MSVEPEPPEPPSLPVQDAVAADQAAAHTTESHDHHGPFHTHCENCGTKLEGPWCHKCGQHDFEFHRSFWHVFMEALETLFHFEGKFFRNIVTLLFRPGVLTADFNAGKRATQMPPFRLYIFVSFIFFLLIFLGEKEDNFVRETKGKPHQGFSIDGAPVVLGLDDPASPEKEHTPTPGEPRLVDQVRTLAEQVQTGQTETLKKYKQGKPAGEASAFEQFLEAQAQRMTDPERRQQLSRWIQAHLPHMLMLCLPFFALYTRLLFRKSGQVYLQHLVLSVHFHTFIYLWVLLSRGWEGLVALPGWGLDGWVAFACGLWLCAYPFLMLRRLFANTWPKTVVKTLLLTVIYTLTLSLGFFATAVGAFLMT